MQLKHDRALLQGQMSLVQKGISEATEARKIMEREREDLSGIEHSLVSRILLLSNSGTGRLWKRKS